MSGCNFPAIGAPPIRAFSESIDLRWDPPAEQSLVPGTDVFCYYVYVRRHGIGGWRLIGQVPASASPGIKLLHSDFGNGAFDFAVSSATSKGSESRLHASSDVTADPTGGWYLLWY